jgi:hypothetical protein
LFANFDAAARSVLVAKGLHALKCALSASRRIIFDAATLRCCITRWRVAMQGDGSTTLRLRRGRNSQPQYGKRALIRQRRPRNEKAPTTSRGSHYHATRRKRTAIANPVPAILHPMGTAASNW